MQAEAVQLPIPEATAYRGTCLRHLECTWLQIYILSHVLSGSPAPDLPGVDPGPSTCWFSSAIIAFNAFWNSRTAVLLSIWPFAQSPLHIDA